MPCMPHRCWQRTVNRIDAADIPPECASVPEELQMSVGVQQHVPPIEITGATGDYAPYINGTYTPICTPTGRLYNGRVLLRKQRISGDVASSDIWLFRYATTNYWVVSPRLIAPKDENSSNTHAYAYFLEEGQLTLGASFDPLATRRCLVWDHGEWQEQGSVQVEFEEQACTTVATVKSTS